MNLKDIVLGQKASLKGYSIAHSYDISKKTKL